MQGGWEGGGVDDREGLHGKGVREGWRQQSDHRSCSEALRTVLFDATDLAIKNQTTGLAALSTVLQLLPQVLQLLART